MSGFLLDTIYALKCGLDNFLEYLIKLVSSLILEQIWLSSTCAID